MDQDLDTLMASEDDVEPKSNTRTIIIVIAAVLLCCCCVVVLGGWFLGDTVYEYFQDFLGSFTSGILNIWA